MTNDTNERRRIQTAVVVAYHDRVALLVRRLVPWAQHRTEAEQVAVVGLIVALEKFDAARGVPFWFFALHYVRDEVQRWLGHGVFWRPGHRHHKTRKHHAEHSTPTSMDAVDGNGETLHDSLEHESNVEELVSTAEGVALVSEFIRTLSADDAHLLINGVGFGRGRANSPRGRHYQSLVTRLRAFVRGKDDEQSLDRVSL